MSMTEKTKPMKAELARHAEPFADVDWARAEADLDARGWAVIGRVLTDAQCAEFIDAYTDEPRYRRTIVMARHAYGEGEYKYFAQPLPPLVQTLRAGAYQRLAPIANRWRAALGDDAVFPERHNAFLAQCRAAGQAKPTPLILKYEAGGHNRLHQDRYGEVFFPLQMAVLLSRPDTEFEGGEFLMAEQRMRQQTRVDVVPLGFGEAVVFAGDVRPVSGKRGPVKARMRHGVAAVRAGRRYTLGLILHDAA